MKLNYRLLIFSILIVLFLSGCFDLETEIRFLEDGSGFVTQWVRMDIADLTAAAALSGTTVEAWTAEVINGIDQAFLERTKVELLDRVTYSTGGKLVLRYRFVFHSTAALNEFLADPDLIEQLVFPAKGRFEFVATKAPCGNDYSVNFSIPPRGEENISRLGYSDIDGLPADEKEPIIVKYYSGKMNLRVVLPGKTKTHSAKITDGRGYPVFQAKVLDYLRKGLKGKAASKGNCDKESLGETLPVDNITDKSEPISIGPAPDPFELQKVAKGLPHFLKIIYEFDCDSKGGVIITASFFVAEPLQGPFEFYFPLLFGAFPHMEAEYDLELGKVEPNLFRYRFKTKKPIKFSKLKSHYVFYGKQKGYYLFRMNLPKLKFGEPPAPGFEAKTLLKVKVSLPEKVRISNATTLKEKTAIWELTDIMLQTDKITLEAITE